MERKAIERRTVLKGSAAAFGILGGTSAAAVTGVEQASADTAQSQLPDHILAAVKRFRETIPANFDREYVEKAIIPFFLTSFYEGERPMLPTIDVNFSKAEFEQRAKEWKPRAEEYTSGYLWKYAQQVGAARYGALTHPGGAAEKVCYADI